MDLSTAILRDEDEARREGVASLPEWYDLWAELHPGLPLETSLYRFEFLPEETRQRGHSAR